MKFSGIHLRNTHIKNFNIFFAFRIWNIPSWFHPLWRTFFIIISYTLVSCNVCFLYVATDKIEGCAPFHLALYSSTSSAAIWKQNSISFISLIGNYCVINGWQCASYIRLHSINKKSSSCTMEKKLICITGDEFLLPYHRMTLPAFEKLYFPQ